MAIFTKFGNKIVPNAHWEWPLGIEFLQWVFQPHSGRKWKVQMRIHAREGGVFFLDCRTKAGSWFALPVAWLLPGTLVSFTATNLSKYCRKGDDDGNSKSKSKSKPEKGGAFFPRLLNQSRFLVQIQIQARERGVRFFFDC